MKVTDQYRSSYEQSLLLPGYARFDAGIFYERNHFSARIIVEDFFAQRYYSDFSNLINDADSPFSIKGRFQFRY